jgi:hypothetical protein
MRRYRVFGREAENDLATAIERETGKARIALSRDMGRTGAP